ncbi:MAG TPA: hypothetical protein VIW92_14370 [Thermoanaerobaculia bacterium]
MADASGVRALRTVVFVVGLGEFLTSILLLFFPETYKEIFGLAPDFNSYYIQQIGMFQFLVGSAILIGSRQAENPAVNRFAVYFNVISAIFWVYYLFSYPGGHQLFHTIVIGFLVYHVTMTAILLAVIRKAALSTAPA